MRAIPCPGVRDVPAIRELRFLQRLALAASSTLDGATLVNLVIAETTEATETVGTLVTPSAAAPSTVSISCSRRQMGSPRTASAGSG